MGAIRARWLTVVTAVVLLTACDLTDPHGEPPAGEVAGVRYPPAEIGDGWRTGLLVDAGLDAVAIERLIRRLEENGDHLVHGIVIVRHGILVLEAYFPGHAHPTVGESPVAFGRDTLHNMSSVTKSFTSALLGIAVHRGIIDSITQPVADFFPEFPWLRAGDKAALTLEHLVTMSSGLEWDQLSYATLDPRNDIAVFQRAPNPWEEYLGRPLITYPGSVFLYSEGSINILGEVIRRASGLRLDEFAARHLFDPLDVADHGWSLIRPELEFVWASGDLRVTPRTMAKLGQLYLDGGVWDGKRILPEEWIEDSIDPVFTFSRPDLTWSDREGYGYAWWLTGGVWGVGSYAAAGWGHQWIAVLPEFDMVVVFTGGAYDALPPTTFYDIMVEGIRPAIR
jgi:CubicO group peptidase (beta-lactamase class C family)